MRLASRSGLIATTLAIGAIAAPTAQAGGLLSATTSDPPGAAQQEAQSFLRIYGHQASTPSSVVPNPDEQLPASTPAVATPGKATVARDQLGDRQLNAALLRIAQVNGRNIPSTTTTAVSTGSHLICVPRSHGCRTVSNPPASTAQPSLGFQYDDAAVGAGVMAAVLALAGTVALTLRRRGHPRLG
jgi:hypothetical protein